MGVKIPSYKLCSPNDLKEMRYRLKGHGRKKGHMADHLTLTSLIDMFATLIFFLIQTFGTAGDWDFTNPAIEIPPSQYAMMLKRVPIITIMRDKVTIEGKDTDSNYEIASIVEEKDWELPKVKEELLKFKTFFEGIHKDVKYPPEVILQADKQIEFMYVKRVLFTLTKMGFSNVNLAVRGKANVMNDTSKEIKN
jgi:biopolymer transport protein ExbD